MTVETQIWFVNIPLVENDERDLSQIVIGFSFPVPTLIINYLRRYLNDVVVDNYPLVKGASIELDTEVDGPENIYLRKYLNDTGKASSVESDVNLDIETDSEFTSFLRRYLNDKS